MRERCSGRCACHAEAREGGSPAIFYFAESDLRRPMISARLRRELFTALALGKTFATSGSNTTTLLPRA